MKTKSRRVRLLLAGCAFALGLGISFTAFARPCCSNCDPEDPDSFCWAICSPEC